MRPRRLMALLAVLAAALLLVLYVKKDRDDGGRTGTAEHATKPAAIEHAASPTKPPAPVDDDVPPALPPPDYKPAERPPVQPMTQEVYVERRTKGLQLLDDTIARVERERDEARKAGQADAA